MRSPRLTTLICTFAALAGVLSFAPPALASHTEVDFFEAPQQLLNFAERNPAIGQLQSLGVRAVRIQLIWDEVAPSPNSKKKPTVNLANPSSYNWGQYVPLMEQMQQLGWKVLLTVTGYAPCWASQCATTRNTDRELVTDPNPTDYGQFMQAVGIDEDDLGVTGVMSADAVTDLEQPLIRKEISQPHDVRPEAVLRV